MSRLAAAVFVLTALLCLILVGTPAPRVVAQPPETPPAPTLWLADALGVVQLERPAGTPLLALPGTFGAQAVAFDALRDTVWVRTAEGLSAYRSSGEALLSLSLGGPDPEGDPEQSPATGESGDTDSSFEASSLPAAVAALPAAHLALGPGDGSVWLGEDLHLDAFLASGQRLHQQVLAEPIVALAFGQAGADQTMLWVATKTGAAALDPGTLTETLRLALPEGSELRALAPTDDAAVWLATATHLLRYTEGQTAAELEIPLEGLVALASAGLALPHEAPGGVWAATATTLVRYDGAGEKLLEIDLWPVDPAGPEATRALVTDAWPYSVWALGSHQLRRFSASGDLLEAVDLGTGMDLRGLSPGPVAPDDQPPSLAFVEPQEGATVATPRPVLRLQYADPETGVRPESLEISLVGISSPLDCQLGPREAVCRPVEDLPAGPVSVQATVADHATNRSTPAGVSFTVEEGVAVPPQPASTPGLYTPGAISRGFEPHKAFEIDGGIEAINTASGNLVLSLPLGQAYSVGPTLSYQFRLTHNANVWQPVRVLCIGQPGCAAIPPADFSVTDPTANAGLGWSLHFGRLFSPVGPSGMTAMESQRWPNRPEGTDGLATWLYVAPDGSSHTLHRLPGRDETYGGLPVRYSKDGSYLRMKHVNATTIHVEHPDGRVSIFRQTDSHLGTLFCGGGVTGCWRFEEMKDANANANRVWVSYAGSPDGLGETWTVNDSTGRQHKLYFSLDPVVRAGGDGGPMFATPLGDEWGDLRRLLYRVDVAASAGRKATYTPVYETRTVVRGCPHDGILLPGGLHNTLRTKVLTRLNLPEGQGYEMNTHVPTTGACNDLSGLVWQLELPTGGSYAYEYETWSFPTRCHYRAQTAPPDLHVVYNRLGIGRKTRKGLGGAVEGSWDYTNVLHGDTEVQGPNCQRATHRETTVDGPTTDGSYTRSTYYHAVTQGPEEPQPTASIDGWQVTDNGLPINKELRIGASASERMYLSQRVASCTGSNCTPARSVYRRYGVEYRNQCNTYALGDPLDPPTCHQVNPQVVAERTVFHDDDDRYVERQYQNFDGAGHFEVELVRDNFNASVRTYRTETQYTATGSTVLSLDANTGYFNVGTPKSYLPNLTSRWILHPYSSQKKVENGRTYLSEVEYTSAGLVGCMRQRKNPSARTAQDLVTQYLRDNMGLATQEIVAGGETAVLSTSSLCSTSGNATNGSRFAFSHVYDFRTLKSTQIGAYPFQYRVDVDKNTGLPAASYDVADQRVALNYDLLGRLVSAIPEAALKAASLHVTYRNPASGQASVLVEQKDGAAVLTREETFFDGQGRPVREVRWHPAGGYSARQTQYDAEGRVSKQSTWQDAGATGTGPVSMSLATSYRFYDPFGRPFQIQAPDGQVTTVTHKGERMEIRKVQVRTSESANESVNLRTVYDGLGRIDYVKTPVQQTFHAYDPNGKLVSQTRSGLNGAGQNVSQQRQWTYDARGLLLEEKLPEVGTGSAGVGTVTYTPDALGNPRGMNDGLHALTYSYDTGGRLLVVQEGSRLWQEWSYGTTNAGGDYARGKLVRAVRHNYPTPTDDWAFEETYEYKGRRSQLSRRVTRQLFPLSVPPSATSGFAFEQTWTYDALGNVISTGYPTCLTTTGSGSCGDDPLLENHPPHTVTTTWAKGLPTRVSSNFNLQADISWHPNFQLSGLAYGNGVQGTFDLGTAGLARPRRMLYSKAGATLFNTGFYEYDGVGNIWAMGSDRYVYDTESRLVSGTVTQAGAGRREDYTYDAFDNLTSYRRDSGAVHSFVVDAKNRLLRDALETTASHLYDAAGNLTRKAGPEGPNAWELTYDGLNMQASFKDNRPGRQNSWLYLYAPGNYRILTFEATTGIRTVKLRDLGGKPLREFTVTGWGPYVSPTNRGESWTYDKDLIYGPQGLVASRYPSGAKRYFHADHLGTPRLITDGAGTVIGRYHLYPYGTTAYASGGGDPNAHFTGHEQDPHGEAHYMLGRIYGDPLMRFTSVDPGRDGWNLYGYVAGNPVVAVDPDGQFVDYLLDGAGLAYDIYEIKTKGASFKTVGTLALDVVLAAVPFVPTIGGVKAGFKAGEVGLDFARAADKGEDLVHAGRHLPFGDVDRVTEVNKTLDRIQSGGPFPHMKDGTVFKNSEGRLPKGNYREYTVETPGASNRGTRRIVVEADSGRTYYTDDHYRTFVQVDPRIH